MTVIITNDPALTTTIDMSALERRADTFATWRASGGDFSFPQGVGIAARRTFDDEKKAFLSMLPMLHAKYPREYVAIAGGTIVDHDRSRVQLVRRFFSRSAAGTPVYIGLVGAKAVAKIPTPMIRRPR